MYENSACKLTVITKHNSFVMLRPNAAGNSNLICVAKSTLNSLQYKGNLESKITKAKFTEKSKKVFKEKTTVHHRTHNVPTQS